VLLEPGIDGLVREVKNTWPLGDRTVPSVSAQMSGRVLPPGGKLPIDFGISPTSFSYISYVDLLEGRYDPSELKGKSVFVGNTAVELGDMTPVPLHRSLPGVVVQALAAESAHEGVLNPLGAPVYFALLALWAALAATVFLVDSWRRNLIGLAVLLGALALADGALYSFARTTLEVVPAALLTVLAYAVATVRSLDQQTLRAIANAIGLRKRDALLKSVVESSTDCILCITRTGIVRTANPAAARLFGCESSMLAGAPIAAFVPTIGDFEALAGEITETDAKTLAGDEFPIEVSVGRVEFSDEPLYTVIVRDISERRAQQRRLEYQASHDSLTALPNRSALEGHLGRALRSNGADESVALLLVDLCRFKEVNDTLGHHVGDRVLAEVARRFEQAAGERAFVARVGGDEFTVVLGRVTDDDMVADLSQRLNASLQAPIDGGGIALDIGLSIGIALYPADAPDTATLLKNADIAMYVAKRRGSSHEYYDVAQDQYSLRRLSMVSELRSAITANELELHYQPQVNLRSGRVHGVEALLRWENPALGKVSPFEFVTLAESTDLIRPLTEWTLRQALEQSRRWSEEGLDVTVAVNLSARILQDVQFPRRLWTLIEASGVNPAALELEITESAMMSDSVRALRVIRELHALGVRIAIDDFGTGFSSLGYLRDLPVQALKLDKSFVMNAEARPDDRIIVESTVQMAHALKLEVVAEGVENEWAVNFLRQAGYDYLQGYHYSAALPAAKCFDWVLNFNRAVDSSTPSLQPYSSVESAIA
jgi:diguanylate cyclase (GGDEF)-like protein/PAS domain S-box-containing protein